jgi:anti-anti-sigma factor
MGKPKRERVTHANVNSNESGGIDPPFHCETTVEPERVLVAVYSDIDIASVGQFRAVLDSAVGIGKPVTVDLSACNYLDSTGISTLVSARNANVPIGVIASRQAAKLLDIVGLTTLLNVTLAEPAT